MREITLHVWFAYILLGVGMLEESGIEEVTKKRDETF